MPNCKIVTFLISGLVFITFQKYSIGQDFSVSSIPKELKANAKAVIRTNDITLELISENRARMKVYYAITILNENGLSNSYFMQPYDKFSKVRDISGAVYDANGKKIKRIKADDIQDFSNISGYSLFDDNRTKYIDPEYRSVPFTVEYSYTVVYTGILDYPDFYLFDDYNVSIMKSSFKIFTDQEIPFQLLEKNITEDNRKLKGPDSYLWTFNNVKAIREESFSMPISELIPNVQIAPNQFNIDGYTGNSETWENIGRWIFNLNFGRNELREETVVHIKNLVKDATTKQDSIRILYEYMQNKTRYVSIQIGIGGWQPFDALTVDKLSYGDCKALTNYTKALFDAVGIRSHYALVSAGRMAAPIIQDFPSIQFNHTILCVPVNNDTLWLECTSQDIPCGYTGTFTSDRKALLILENESKIAHTTILSKEHNIQSRNIKVNLYNNGNGNALVNTRYSGLYFDLTRPVLSMDDKDKRNEIIKQIDIPNFDLLDFSHTQVKSLKPVIQEQLEIGLNNYGTFIGDKMLIRLNLMSLVKAPPYENQKRKSEINIRWPITIIDTVNYSLPSDYHIDIIPENKSIQSDFGSYHTTVSVSNSELLYIRQFTLNKGIYPPEDYFDFIDFFENLAAAEKCKISLVETR